MLAENKGDELLKLAERLDQISSGAVIGATIRGVVFHNDKIPEQAVAAFEQVLELDPELREMPLPRNLFWTQLADDLISSGRIDDARHYLARALSNSPDASLLNILGQTYFLQGMLDDADRSFRQAAELATTDHLAYVNLARVAIQRHQQEEALKQVNRARSLAPGAIAFFTRWLRCIVNSAERPRRIRLNSHSRECDRSQRLTRLCQTQVGPTMHFRAVPGHQNA